MNFINCSNSISPEEIRKTVAFWSENSFQHISSLLNSNKGTTAVLDQEFSAELKELYDDFKGINELYTSGVSRLPAKPDILFRTNKKFIDLLERLKFEGFSGYPILQQSVFHYIYEQRYINAVFGMLNPSGNVLITANFLPLGNNENLCIYNQMYFWSIIGAMHPSLLMDTNAFYNSINGYSREYLTEITNSFNRITLSLSNLKRPIQKAALARIFSEFSALNIRILEFLISAKSGSPKIYSSPNVIRLPESFYGKVEHMIKEHTLVKELNENIKKRLS